MATGSNVAVPVEPSHIDGARNMAVQSTCGYHGRLSPAPLAGHGCCPLSFSLGAKTLDGPHSCTQAPSSVHQQVTVMVLCQEISPSQPLSPAPDCTKTFLTSLGIWAVTGPLLTKAGRAVSSEQHHPG